MDATFNLHEVRSNAKETCLVASDQTPSLVQSMVAAMPALTSSQIPFVSHQFKDGLRTTGIAKHHDMINTMRLAMMYGDLPADAFEPVPLPGNSKTLSPRPLRKPFLLQNALNEALDTVEETCFSIFKQSEDFELAKIFDAQLPTRPQDQVLIQADVTSTSASHCDLTFAFSGQLDGSSLSIASKRPPSQPTTTNPPMSKRRRIDTKPSFRSYQEKAWMEQFDNLIKFKEIQGHCIVPNNYPENQMLSRWVKRQRYQYKLKMSGKGSTMTDDRIKLLEDIGFVWNSHAIAWGKRFSELEQYHKDNGNCNVPSNYAQNPELAVWVKCQRRQYRLFWSSNKSSSMTWERMQALNELGFSWKIRC